MCVAVQTVPGTCANLEVCSAQIRVSLHAYPIHSLADSRKKAMSLGTILLILLILLLVGAIPAWPHSRSWGYAPSGLLGVVVVVLLVLLLLGRI